MAIEDGNQVLPTDGFDSVDNNSDAIDAEKAEFDNSEQPITDEASLAVDVDIDDVDGEANEDEVNVPTKEVKAEAQPAEEQPEEPKQEEPVSKKDDYLRQQRSVQRRFDKITKQREDARRETEQLKAEIAELKSKFNQQEQQSESELLANRIRNATRIKQQLLEDGEYAEVAKVDNDIMQMKIYQDRLAAQAEQQKYQQEQQYQQYQQEQQYQQSQQQDEYIPDIQTQWIQNNRRYGADKHYTQYVNDIYDAMIEEGWDPEEAEMYAELNRRTGTPDPLQGMQQQQAPAPQQQQAPAPAPKPRRQAAPPPNAAQAQPRAKSKGLTEADKVNMRNWGLDVNDPEVRKEWLRNKGVAA